MLSSLSNYDTRRTRLIGLFIASNVVAPVAMSWIDQMLIGIHCPKWARLHIASALPLSMKAALFYASTLSNTNKDDPLRDDALERRIQDILQKLRPPVAVLAAA